MRNLFYVAALIAVSIVACNRNQQPTAEDHGLYEDRLDDARGEDSASVTSVRTELKLADELEHDKVYRMVSGGRKSSFSLREPSFYERDEVFLTADDARLLAAAYHLKEQVETDGATVYEGAKISLVPCNPESEVFREWIRRLSISDVKDSVQYLEANFFKSVSRIGLFPDFVDHDRLLASDLHWIFRVSDASQFKFAISWLGRVSEATGKKGALLRIFQERLPDGSSMSLHKNVDDTLKAWLALGILRDASSVDDFLKFVSDSSSDELLDLHRTVAVTAIRLIASHQLENKQWLDLAFRHPPHRGPWPEYYHTGLFTNLWTFYPNSRGYTQEECACLEESPAEAFRIVQAILAERPMSRLGKFDDQRWETNIKNISSFLLEYRGSRLVEFALANLEDDEETARLVIHAIGLQSVPVMVKHLADKNQETPERLMSILKYIVESSPVPYDRTQIAKEAITSLEQHEKTRMLGDLLKNRISPRSAPPPPGLDLQSR